MRSAVIVDTDIMIDLAHENEVAIKDFRSINLSQ
jgi:hypothetical protein